MAQILKHRLVLFLSLLTILLIHACDHLNRPGKSVGVQDTENLRFSTAEDERDAIFMLLAYSIVYNDWQNSKEKNESRGYNIGAVLVNEDYVPVFSALNEVNRLNNGTQHAEVRVIQSYIESSGEFYPEDYTVYCTLEPCAMCAGMITMSRIQRVVYGQADSNYGGVFERLYREENLISETETQSKSYPRRAAVTKSVDPFSESLDSMYLDQNRQGITDFLTMESTREVFKAAHDLFLNYKPRFDTNRKVLSEARIFFEVSK